MVSGAVHQATDNNCNFPVEVSWRRGCDENGHWEINGLAPIPIQAERERAKVARLQTKAKLDEQNGKLPRWDAIGRAELTRLIWSKPTLELTQRFGVTEAAVRKRCRKLHIPKPPPGFWQKVQAGVIPHPNGKVCVTFGAIPRAARCQQAVRQSDRR